MLVFTVEPREGSITAKTWKIGEDTEELERASLYATEVTATDKELELIFATFVNLPFFRSKDQWQSMTWYGDHAKFICANL